MKTKKRLGSVVPCEDVDPYTGSFLTYGIISGWQDSEGRSTSRVEATYALIEMIGRRVGDWSDWAEEHAWKLRDEW